MNTSNAPIRNSYGLNSAISWLSMDGLKGPALQTALKAIFDRIDPDNWITPTEYRAAKATAHALASKA